jgi:hypothetical protein
MVGIEAKIHFLGLVETADEKTSYDQQHEGTRHLRNNQDASCELTAWAGRRPAPRFMKDRTNIRASGTQSRHHPDKQARKQNRNEGEKVDPRVRPKIQSQG